METKHSTLTIIFHKTFCAPPRYLIDYFLFWQFFHLKHDNFSNDFSHIIFLEANNFLRTIVEEIYPNLT